MALEKTLKSLGLDDTEAEKILRAFKTNPPTSYSTRELPIDSERVRFTVVSDLHMGHKCYRPDILRNAIASAKKNRSQFFLIPGDILEGMSGREGHIYELTHIGASAQLEYAESELRRVHLPIFAITATNSHDGWYASKNNAGFQVGPELERRLGKERFSFEGYDEATVKLKNGLRIRMTHPGDGTAYAISYKLQKYINALSGGQKPDVLFQGHYHKAAYLFYRNIHAFDAGTLCAQTDFMKKKMSPAMLGFWNVDVYFKKGKGIQSIIPEFVPFYE